MARVRVVVKQGVCLVAWYQAMCVCVWDGEIITVSLSAFTIELLSFHSPHPLSSRFHVSFEFF